MRKEWENRKKNNVSRKTHFKIKIKFDCTTAQLVKLFCEGLLFLG